MPDTTQIKIVVIGGSFAGILTTHRILKDIPSASVTLINPSRRFFYNIASPRIVAKPNAITSDEYLLDIPPFFSHYPSGSFTFVEGSVNAIEPALRFVQLDDDKTIAYDYLVIASGSTTDSTLQSGSSLVPWKSPKFCEVSEAIETAQSTVASAEHIVIAGAGPVGIEFAGELAEASKPKRITLISSTEQLLPTLKETVGTSAETILKKKNVHLIKGTRVKEASRDGKSRKWTINLDNGEQLAADAFVSATGVRPNSEFVPKNFLSPEGWVLVDNNLRVIHNIADNDHGPLSIFALGDVTIHKPRIVPSIKEQIPVLVANLKADINASPADSSQRPTYSPTSMSSIMIPIGKSNGTGLVYGKVPWEWVVWLIKGRNYLIQFVPRLLQGRL